MLNWPGFLQWSLKYTDGTRDSSAIPPLTEEQREWLNEALFTAGRDDTKEMLRLSAKIEETCHLEEEVEANCDRLAELEDILTALDMDINFCKVGAATALFDMALNPETPEKLRIFILSTIKFAASNSWFVQNFFSQAGFQRLMPLVLQSHGLLRLRTISALYAMVCGESLANLRLFTTEGGVSILREVLETETEANVLGCALRFVTDLLASEDLLLLKGDRLEHETVRVSAPSAASEAALNSLKSEYDALGRAIVRCIDVATSEQSQPRAELYISLLKCAAALTQKSALPELKSSIAKLIHMLEEKEFLHSDDEETKILIQKLKNAV